MTSSLYVSRLLRRQVCTKAAFERKRLIGRDDSGNYDHKSFAGIEQVADTDAEQVT